MKTFPHRLSVYWGVAEMLLRNPSKGRFLGGCLPWHGVWPKKRNCISMTYGVQGMLVISLLPGRGKKVSLVTAGSTHGFSSPASPSPRHPHLFGNAFFYRCLPAGWISQLGNKNTPFLSLSLLWDKKPLELPTGPKDSFSQDSPRLQVLTLTFCLHLFGYPVPNLPARKEAARCPERLSFPDPARGRVLSVNYNPILAIAEGKLKLVIVSYC